MTVRIYQESDRERWDSYVNKSPSSNLYQRIGWKYVIERTFGHKTYYLLSEDAKGNISGILPLVHLKSRIFGSFMVSVPFFNYGGVCADTSSIRDRLISEAIAVANKVNATHIEFRESQLLTEELPVKTAKVSMHLHLPTDSTDLLKSLGSKLRSQIKRPEKEGMSAHLGQAQELDKFYTIFAKNMRDLGTPVYSKSFFHNIMEEFPDSTWVNIVRTTEGKPVAAGFLIGFRGTLEIPWASSLREYNQYSPNMLLYWSSLKFACDKRYKLFDFGRSTPGEGTYKFKQQWGAQPVQLYWHYWMKNGGAIPEINPKNPKYQLAINLWKKMPVGITRLIGPSIVQYIP